MYNPYETHLTERVMSASPTELTLMLFSGAQEAVAKARKCLQAGDIMGRSKAVNKAMAIVAELDSCVDVAQGGEIANALKQLYVFVINQLQLGHFTQQDQPFVEAAAILATLTEGWKGCVATPEAITYGANGEFAGTAVGSRYSYAA